MVFMVLSGHSFTICFHICDDRHLFYPQSYCVIKLRHHRGNRMMYAPRLGWLGSELWLGEAR